MRERSADILIAGAGPAGATIARLLALRGKRVVLIDPVARRTDRVEIVSPSCVPVVEGLGIAHVLHDTAFARPGLGIRRRWGGAQTEIDDFFRRPGGRGYVIDRARFDEALRQAAGDAGVAFAAGRLVAARRDVGAVIAKIDSGTDTFEISAALAIDATGRPSALARRLGARRVANERLIAQREILHPSGLGDACWLDVEGTPEDWSYSITGPGGRRERWTIYRPAGHVHRRARSRADASSALLSRAAGDGWIAIGDAAASFDPVTSQGLANALSTALVAAGAILSPRGLDDSAARVYSGAVAATWRHSEAGRAKVYAALHPDAA